MAIARTAIDRSTRAALDYYCTNYITTTPNQPLESQCPRAAMREMIDEVRPQNQVRSKPPKLPVVITQPARPRAIIAHETTMLDLISRNRLSVLALTFTFHSYLTNPEREKKIKSFITNVIGSRYVTAVVVRELHDGDGPSSGLLHLHLLVLVYGNVDVFTGVDHVAIKRGDHSSATPALLAEIEYFDEKIANGKYGLGTQYECLPVRSPVGYTRYLLKSLWDPVVYYRKLNRISYCGDIKSDRVKGTDICLASGRAQEFRQKAQAFAQFQYDRGLLEAPTEEAFKARYGRDWYKQHGRSISNWDSQTVTVLPELSYEDMRALVAAARRAARIKATISR